MNDKNNQDKLADKLNNLQNGANNAIKSMIRNISLICLIIFIIIGTFIALGASFNFGLESRNAQVVLVFTFAISVVLLFIWFGNARRAALLSEEFNKVLLNYEEAAKDVNIGTLRAYMEQEKDDRKKEFENTSMRISGLNYQELYSLSTKELNKRKLSLKAKKIIKKCRKNKFPELAFPTAEKLLNLATKESNRHGDETTHSAEGIFSGVAITTKITTMLPYLFVGISIAISFSFGNIFQAIFSLLIMCLSFAMAAVSGYQIGHKSIDVYRSGVYTTAIRYLNNCNKYAAANNKPYRTIINIDAERAKLQKLIVETVAKEFDIQEEEANDVVGNSDGYIVGDTGDISTL